MATKIVKSLQFPGSEDLYQINAAYLEGASKKDILDEIERVEQKVDTISGFDALRYMGTIDADTALPAANKGDVYKVTFKGVIKGTTVQVEVGDMLICNTDDTAAGNVANWDVIQVNIDVDAILDHYHTGEVSLTKTNKTITHEVSTTTSTVTAEFEDGTASVTGNHGHTASGSVTLTPSGTVAKASITPDGSVTIGEGDDFTVATDGTVEDSTTSFVTDVTISDHAAHTHTGTTASSETTVTGTVTISKGTGAANYTPEGTLTSSPEIVTNVTIDGGSVDAHSADSVEAGGFTPAGSVVGTVTATGTVASHKHDVAITTTPEDVLDIPTYSNDGMDGILTFGSSSVVKSASISEEKSVAPTFTGNEVAIDATFTGTAVAAHKHTINVDDHTFTTPTLNVTTGTHTHTFNGTGVQLVGAFSNGVAAAHTHTFTSDANTTGLNHVVSAPTSTHAHKFTPTTAKIGATFEGKAAEHDHTFTGNQSTHDVTVTVNAFNGSFTGTSAGTVAVRGGTDLVKTVTVGNHTIETSDSGSVTTGKALQGED